MTTLVLRCPVAACEEPLVSSRYVGQRIRYTCRDGHTFTMSTEHLRRLSEMRRYAETLTNQVT